MGLGRGAPGSGVAPGRPSACRLLDAVQGLRWSLRNAALADRFDSQHNTPELRRNDCVTLGPPGSSLHRRVGETPRRRCIQQLSELINIRPGVVIRSGDEDDFAAGVAAVAEPVRLGGFGEWVDRGDAGAQLAPLQGVGGRGEV